MSDTTSLPPVRLRSEAELARDALASPLLSRAARLARWVSADVRVGAGGELLEAHLPAAAAALGLTADEDGIEEAAQAWGIAVDCALVEITDEEEGTVVAGDELAVLASGSPREILDIWLEAMESTLADAAVPDLEDLVGGITEDGEFDPEALDWDPEGEAEFLDTVLGGLYLMTVGEDTAEPVPVPLPALAASVLVPEDMQHPTDAVMEEITEAMVRLDDQFQLIAPVGLVEFRPVDSSLLVEAGEEDHAPVPDDADVSLYGVVRLTPLGLYGMRERLQESGLDVPVVGELAEQDARSLLDGTAGWPERATREEIQGWLSRREPREAAQELLAASRGADHGAPLRRLLCQQALATVGPTAEPCLREVLDDPELGGLARVWLAEHQAADVPPPSEDMVFWLTMDTLAAQIAAEGNSEELQDLVEGLAQQHSSFFDSAWRVAHPDTADVLDAMGRLHPDKKIAKEARKAAFKARSRKGS